MKRNSLDDFNKSAAGWDLKPERIRRSEAIAEYIRDKLILDQQKTRMMDFGCGTGNLAFCLQRYVRSVLAVDEAEKMLEQVEQKAQQAGINHISTQRVNIEHEAHLLPRAQFDLIASVMTLHHIENVASLLLNLHGLLAQDGVLCLCDLDKEDGTFHDNGMFIPHHGFERENLQKLLERCGFFDVRFYTPYVIKKDRGRGRVDEYPLFLCLAWRDHQKTNGGNA